MVMVFAIHQHELTTGIHVFPHLKLPPHPIPLGCPRQLAEVPCFFIELALVICFTHDNVHVSVLFSQIIPPSSSPTETKSLSFFLKIKLFK